MHNYKEENDKRLAAYKALEAEYQRSDNVDELNKRVINLQFANTRLFQELQEMKKINEKLLNRINEPEVVEQNYTLEDLRMLKAMGVGI